MSRIILASKSAARSELLRNAGVVFETAGAGVDEDVIKQQMLGQGASPAQIAAALADAKALAVASRTEGLVIGADQTLDFEGRLFDKADTVDEARARLLELRGRRHQLHSAMTIARGGEVLHRELASATLVMRDFSEAWLDGYLERQGKTILASVGCYQLESEGVQLFERIEGDYFVILGLPLLGLLQFLRRQGALAA